VIYSGRSNRHFIVGVVILVVGVVLLFGEFGIVDPDRIFMFWPLILIYFGVNRFIRRPSATGWFWSAVLILLGISFQLQELGLRYIHVEVIWPALLICGGIILILRRYEGRSRWENPPFPGPPPGPMAGPPPGPPPEMPPGPTIGSPPPSTTGTPMGSPGVAPAQSNFAQGGGPNWQGFGKNWNDFHQRMDEFGERMHDSFHDARNWNDSSAPRLNEVNIFWGGKRRIVAKNFVGGEIVSIFGGFDIDLREADILGNVAEIEVVTIFGGGDIRVPLNWEIVMEAVGIFGGCSDRTRHPDNPTVGASTAGASAVPQPKILIVKGVAIFGGMIVKN
jgi:hypothetical protein